MENSGRSKAVADAVRQVIEAVRTRGDAALCEFTEKWDGVRLTPNDLRVPVAAIESATVDTLVAQAFERAAKRIRWFHEQVKPRTKVVEDHEGVRMGIRWTPLDAVGLYIPGGKASYPSTLAMTAIPAQIAEVKRVVVVSPPGPDGEVSPAVLMAAKIVGVTEVYRVGGAQAIAALAFGTDSVPRVDKVYGPGNRFVAEAKKQLFGVVGIDLLAGPSEIVVYADDSTEPEWAAADLIAQAEHDEEARVTLLTSSDAVREAVCAAVDRLVTSEPRRETIDSAWRRNGRAEVVKDPATAAERINAIAPEHLTLQVKEPWKVLPLIRNAGAIFLGSQSPVAVGDYYAGPNHVLPTDTTARFSSCLSVDDFMKRSNLCEMNARFLKRWGEDVEVLATCESLPAHATSVRLRRQSIVEEEPGDETGDAAVAAISPIAARRGVRQVEPYVLVEEEGEVKLNQNESPWDLPAELKDEVARRLRDLPWNRYHQTVPHDLAARLAADAGVEADDVIVASGSNLLLQWVFAAYAGPGSTIVAPRPSFSLYPLWAEVCEAQLESVPLSETFDYDVGSLSEAIRRSRPAITVLCLPNNPTGSEMATVDVRALATEAGEQGGLLVVDEAYREFSGPDNDRTNLVRDFDNVVLVRTFSKAYAAAGMRLGYVIAPPAVATELRKIVPPFHLNLFAAVLGITVLENRQLFEDRVRQLIAERDRVTTCLSELEGVTVVPSAANFFLIHVASPEKLFTLLKKDGILVRRLGSEPLLEGCLRINVGTSEENDRLLEALPRLLS